MSGTTKDTKHTKRELPEGWRWVRFSDVISRVTPRTRKLKATEYQHSGRYPVIDQGQQAVVGYTDDKDALIVDPLPLVVFGDHTKTAKYVDYPFTLGADGVVLLSPSENIDSRFFYYWLSQVNLRNLGYARHFGVLKKQDIPLPPLSEQRRIAAVLAEQLGAVDAARAAAEARLKAINALPAAFLRQVFPQPGASLPKSWRWAKLGKIALNGPDNGIFKRRSDFGQGVPVVNVSDLYRSLYVDLSLAERVQITKDELKRYEIMSGDLFFCRSSLKREGIGWCCLIKEVPEPAVFECHVMRVHLKPTEAIPQYVAHYWQHPAVRERVIGNSRTATMTTMNQKDLADVEIPLPTLSEQRRIAAMLAEQMGGVDAARAAAQAELETINALPAALLRRAFYGEI